MMNIMVTIIIMIDNLLFSTTTKSWFSNKIFLFNFFPVQKWRNKIDFLLHYFFQQKNKKSIYYKNQNENWQKLSKLSHLSSVNVSKQNRNSRYLLWWWWWQFSPKFQLHFISFHWSVVLNVQIIIRLSLSTLIVCVTMKEEEKKKLISIICPSHTHTHTTSILIISPKHIQTTPKCFKPTKNPKQNYYIILVL